MNETQDVNKIQTQEEVANYNYICRNGHLVLATARDSYHYGCRGIKKCEIHIYEK